MGGHSDLSFFWILLILAFLADKGYLSSKYAGGGDGATGIGGTKAKVTDASHCRRI